MESDLASPTIRRRGSSWRFLALLGVASACGSDQTPPPTPRPQRIVLISMDTVRADHVSGYGGDTTPQLRRIAEEGVLLRDFYAASTYTIPSHASIFTGLDPAEHGMSVLAARLGPGVTTLAQHLKDAGYRTQGYHEGGFIAGRFGFDRGFDSYEERPRISVAKQALPEILGWMRAQGEAPYFLFVHTYAAHYPYGGIERYRQEHPERGLPDDQEVRQLRSRVAQRKPPFSEAEKLRCIVYNHFTAKHGGAIGNGWNQLPEDFDETDWFDLDIDQIKTSYNQRITLVDEAIGKIRQTLEDLGQWEDTLLIALSDHGEAFFEHGLQRHDYIPFNEVLKVPCVISYPRLLASRSGSYEVPGLTWHLDIFPTVLSLAGIPTPVQDKGVDLTPVLRGQSPIDDQRVIHPAVLRPAHREQKPLRRVTLLQSAKFIAGHDHFGDQGGFLFDLSKDPQERVNLRDQETKKFRLLEARAKLYETTLRSFPAVHQDTGQPIQSSSSDQAQLSPEELARLAELGYVEEADGSE